LFIPNQESMGETNFDILKTGGRGDTETNQEHVGLRIAQRSKSIVIFLPGSIKQPKSVRLISDPSETKI